MRILELNFLKGDVIIEDFDKNLFEYDSILKKNSLIYRVQSNKCIMQIHGQGYRISEFILDLVKLFQSVTLKFDNDVNNSVIISKVEDIYEFEFTFPDFYAEICQKLNSKIKNKHKRNTLSFKDTNVPELIRLIYNCGDRVEYI